MNINCNCSNAEGIHDLSLYVTVGVIWLLNLIGRNFHSDLMRLFHPVTA